MQVEAVHYLPRHDVDPAVRHRQRESLEIEFERPSEFCDVPIQLALQGGKGRR